MLAAMANRISRRTYLCLPLVLAAGCAVLVPRSAGPVERAKAPDFTLTGHDDKPHSLAGLTKRGPAVVVFYRGFW